MGRIDQETVQRILDAADIVEVVSDFVKLRRSGANYKGLCPFHNERTPSFSVNKARNICKCFSCGKGGSPVNFIMEHEQMTYSEALRYLARKYNIEIVEKDVTDDERRAQNEREGMLALNEFALEHFRHNLLETVEGRSVAMPYFRHRGLNDAMIARFHLGYAIDRGDEFTSTALAAGYKREYLLATGLSGQSQREGADDRLYDKYRGRVIFPIHSVSGRVVGFGARTMRTDKNIAKYVNSPESIIYHKNLELYGFYQAKSAIAKADKCIMVEGYLDVISMHQSGVENVVASSGTSLTEGQIRAVRRFTDNVTLIYDADAAGIKASLRGIRMLLAEKMNVKVLSLPPGDDPDSFAQSHSSTEVADYLREHEVDIIAFMTAVLMKDVDPRDPTARAKVINVILETVACVDDAVKRQEYISECARSMNLDETVIIRQTNVFIARHREEEYKEHQRQLARESLQRDAAAQGATSAADGAAQEAAAEAENAAGEEAPAPLLDLTDRHLLPYETELARYLVRYGVCYMADIPAEDGTIVRGTVSDVIANELEMDGYTLADAGCLAVFREVMRLRRDEFPAEQVRAEERADIEIASEIERRRRALAEKGGSLDALASAENMMMKEMEELKNTRMLEFEAAFVRERLINSPDDQIRRLAGELVTDRYTLSRLYTRDGETLSEVEQLQTLVPRAINELRGARLRDMIKARQQKLAALDPSDIETANALMTEIMNFQEYQKRLVKVLGDRIILPKR